MEKFINILFLIIGTSLVLIACLNPNISKDAATWMGIVGFLCSLGCFVLEIMDRGY